MRERIVVGLSGGVDSSVAAALLVEQGFDVIGVTLRVWPWREPEDATKKFGSCCSPATVDDARAVARRLGIPYYLLNSGARVRARGDRALRARVRGGPHAGAVRGVQPRGEVRLARAARARVGRGRGGDRPLRAHHARSRLATLPALARPRRAQGPVRLPLAAHAGAARRRALSGGRSHQGRGAREGPRASGSSPRRSPRARRSASSRTTTTAGSCAGACRRRSSPGRSWTGRGRCWAATRGSPTTRSASGAGSAWPRPGPST